MSFIGTRGLILVIGTALGLAGIAHAEPKGPADGQLILAQSQEQSEEERRERRQRAREEGREERREGREERREGRQERRDDRQENRAERREERRERAEDRQDNRGERRENRRERAEERRDERQENRGERREERRERADERRDDRRERAEGRGQDRGERREDRRERAEDRQDNRGERRENRRERAEERRDERQENRGERRENRRERAEDRRDDRRDRAEGRQERREISREEREERRRERREFTRDRLKDIARERRRREENGRVVIEEPGNRRIIREKGRRAFIEHDETERLRGAGRDFRREKGPRGRERTIITRPNGVQIITVEGRDGRLLRRIKRFPNGREVLLINNEYEGRRGRHRRDDRDGFRFIVDLPDLVFDDIERRRYYAYADEADEERIYEILSAPPVEDLEDDYTLEEIRYSPDLRQRFRKLNLNTINFQSGSWEVNVNQIGKLDVVARVINRIVDKDPEQVFLVAGHTDAVGSEEDNLSLSDRRAETVARILTDEYDVPPENLVTQGYGESDLLIETESDEVRNRRVEFMRITPYLAQKD